MVWLPLFCMDGLYLTSQSRRISPTLKNLAWKGAGFLHLSEKFFLTRWSYHKSIWNCTERIRVISRRYPPKMRTVTDKRRTLSAPKTRGKLQERRRVETAIRQAGQRRTPFAAALQPPLFWQAKSRPGCPTCWYRFYGCLWRGVCLAAARVSAPHSSMPSTRHGAR